MVAPYLIFAKYIYEKNICIYTVSFWTVTRIRELNKEDAITNDDIFLLS